MLWVLRSCSLTDTQQEDPDVCEGAIKLEGPIIASDLRWMNPYSRTGELFCNTLMGLCDYPKVSVPIAQFPSPKPPTRRPAPSGQAPIKIVHYSDIHIDHQYITGSNANCSKPICCR
jgi:sphingomyelin phosphodiesterase